MPQVIIDQNGPLPITANVQTGSTGPALLTVAGSVWSQSDGVLIGFDVIVDGTRVGTASIWSNGASTHRAVVPMHLPFTLDKQFTGDPPTEPPTYVVELVASTPETTSDVNDRFQVVLHA